MYRGETLDLRDKLMGETAEARYSALKGITSPRMAMQLKDYLLDICLRDEWGPNRSEAVRALGLLWPHPDVQRAYSNCLDAEPYVANTVVEFLASRLDAPSVELLGQRYVAADNAKLRYSILQAFCSAPAEVASRFILDGACYSDEDERIRALAVSLLSRACDPELKALFVARLKDESQRVRAGAVEALSAICSPEEILELLPPYLEDASNRVRANALIPLIRNGYRLAEIRLREMIGHTSNFFRSSAAYVLGEITPTSLVVSQLDGLSRDADELVRRRALASVERLGARFGMPAAAHSVQPDALGI